MAIVSTHPHWRMAWKVASMLLLAACIPGMVSGRPLNLHRFQNDPRITVLEPQPGQIVSPGQFVRVRVEVDPSLMPNNVLILPGGKLAGPPFEGYAPIPEHLTGEFTIGIGVANTEEGVIAGHFLNVMIVPPEPPLSIEVGSGFIVLGLPADVAEQEIKRLTVAGVYPGAIRRDISDSQFGTVHVSLTPEIVTVDETGLLTPVAPGYGFIETRNGEAKATTKVTIQTAPRVFPPALDMTDSAEFTYSGIRQDPVTQRFSQQVSVKYLGELPCPEPVQIGLRNVPEDIEVLKDHVGRSEPAAGVPLFWVRTETETRGYLSPGGTGVATLVFRNRHGRPITYSTSLYCGRVP